MARQLDEAYRRTVGNLATNTAVTIEHEGEHEVVSLAPLERQEEPASLIALRGQVAACLPQVDLPEVLLEIQARTGFAGEFTHVSEAEARAADLDVSLCAVLLAEACNIGLEPLVRPDVPAPDPRPTGLGPAELRPRRDHHPGQRPAGRLPGPDPAGAGLGRRRGRLGRRPAVRRPGPHPQRRPQQRSTSAPAAGVTYYNFTSDQFTGFHAHRRPRHAPRLAVHPGRAAGAADRPAPPRGHERHGRLQRRGLRPVLAAGLPVQPPAGRLRRGPVLADGPEPPTTGR